MRFPELQAWLDWQETLHPVVMDLGLKRPATVLNRLGWKPLAFPVITVAGTNGKGSTVAMAQSLLRAQGSVVGSYTSPHVHRFNERICVNGVPVLVKLPLPSLRNNRSCKALELTENS